MVVAAVILILVVTADEPAHGGADAATQQSAQWISAGEEQAGQAAGETAGQGAVAGRTEQALTGSSKSPAKAKTTESHKGRKRKSSDKSH